MISLDKGPILAAALSAGLVCYKIAMAWALERRLLPSKNVVCIAAAAAGTIDVFRPLLEESGGGYGKVASEYGNDVLLRHCIMRAAARFGQLHVLQYFEGHGFPLDFVVFAMAMQGCQIEVLDWLKEKGCPRFQRQH